MTEGQPGETEGLVEEELPRGLYRVRIDDGRTLVASLPAASRHGIVRVARGDRVVVIASSIDGSRAKIVRKT